MAELKSFKEIDSIIRPTYYNSDDDTINNFLIPVLKRSKIYKRETYSFSSAIFSLINHALSDLIRNGSKICYIVGFDIGEKDVKAIEEGLEDEFGFESRVPCSDGNCIGIIINGRCNICGQLYKG